VRQSLHLFYFLCESLTHFDELSSSVLELKPWLKLCQVLGSLRHSLARVVAVKTCNCLCGGTFDFSYRYLDLYRWSHLEVMKQTFWSACCFD